MCIYIYTYTYICIYIYTLKYVLGRFGVLWEFSPRLTENNQQNLRRFEKQKYAL